ncbi:Uroporphyrinogen-III synthase [Fodinibius salinus]|uniref:Uroporphyrinogen-III synthase n=1 Tax=Fodinibius salinus TaxID=860790 RepID=A0A5D3YHR5_9BACT|nr:uroporphyrinogen-III synthase [Fodinibius salinus]TYP93313.1 Uroporphyrinogen-III synthase [Fodinibius salinus]
MRQDKRNILVTRPLTARQIEYARILGLEPIIKPALHFNFPDYWDSVLKVINENLKSNWVFTSTNGVKALNELMQAGLQVRPEVQLFAVGSKTREALQDLGLNAKVPRTEDSEHLAELIIEEGKSDSLIYFHGNLSRDEMTNRLVENDIEVIEVEVYETVINPVEMPREHISGILFYSPSAVEGFAQGEGFDNELPPLFAIGPTTAKALKKETDQHIEIAKQPDTEVLLRTTSNYIFNQVQGETSD